MMHLSMPFNIPATVCRIASAIMIRKIIPLITYYNLNSRLFLNLFKIYSARLGNVISFTRCDRVSGKVAKFDNSN